MEMQVKEEIKKNGLVNEDTSHVIEQMARPGQVDDFLM